MFPQGSGSKSLVFVYQVETYWEWCRATEQMMMYKPAEHEETTSVAPLLQFFELVHIGDTIQSMVQVYFDKELVRISTIHRLIIIADSLGFIAGPPYRSHRLLERRRAREKAI